MYFQLSDKLKTITTTFLDESRLVWDSSSWSRAKIKDNVFHHDTEEEISPNNFITINSYLFTWPHEKIIQLENIYRKVFDDLEDCVDIIELNQKLHQSICDIFNLIDWAKFSYWCLFNGGLNLNIGVKEKLEETDTLETTYFTKDYEELIFFSVILKLVMPIWGLYFHTLKNNVGNDRVLLYALSLIRNDFVENNSAFKKLEDHIERFVNNKLPVTGFAINSDFGHDEVSEYILATALWKKVILFDGRDRDRSIVRNVYNIIKDTCNGLVSSGPNQIAVKNSVTGEELSESAIWKLNQLIPVGIEPLSEHCVCFVRDAVTLGVYAKYHISPIFVKNVDETITEATLKEIGDLLPQPAPKLEFHIPLMSFVIGPVVGARNIELLRYRGYQSCLIVASSALLHWGFPALADLLITIPTLKDIRQVSYGSHKTQTLMTSEQIDKINKIYSHVGMMNPGLQFIETTIKEVVGYNWEFTHGQVENITQELANLLIRQKS